LGHQRVQNANVHREGIRTLALIDNGPYRDP